MITQKDLEKIHVYAVRKKKKIIFVFVGYNFRLVINSFIHAEDENEYIVQWKYAFGNRLPSHVLGCFKIKEIIVKSEKSEERFKKLDDFLKTIPTLY